MIHIKHDNGYVSAIIKNTIYKSVIILYDLSGNELFRRYVSSNYAICTDVSKDNKYLAVGEIDHSGTILKSYVKIISVDLAATDPKNSIIYTYESENGEIINNINYQDKDAYLNKLYKVIFVVLISCVLYAVTKQTIKIY